MKVFRVIWWIFTLIILCQNTGWSYSWPVSPFNTQHSINATLGEYRSGHFHAGVDIGDGVRTIVYPVINGTIPTGGGIGREYVKVGNFDYVHIIPNPDLELGQFVTTDTVLGEIAPESYTGYPPHLHFEEDDGAYNPLRTDGLTPYSDTDRTYVSTLDFYRQGTNQQILSPLYGKIDILSRAWDAQSNGSDNVGVYQIGYYIQTQDDILLKRVFNIQFDSVSNADLDCVYNTTQSNISNYYYWVTNDMNENQYFNTNLRRDQDWDGSNARINSEADYPDDKYKISVLAFDIQGNGGNIENQEGAMTREVVFDNFRPYVHRVTVTQDGEHKYGAYWNFANNILTLTPTTQEDRNPKPLKASVATFWIEFSESVENPTASLVGKNIPFTAIDNTNKNWKGELNIPDNGSMDGKKQIITINATDIADNRILELSNEDTINPATQLTRDVNGNIQGTGGADTRHQLTIDTTPPNSCEKGELGVKPRK